MRGEGADCAGAMATNSRLPTLDPRPAIKRHHAGSKKNAVKNIVAMPVAQTRPKPASPALLDSAFEPNPATVVADWMLAALNGKPYPSERWYVDATGRVAKTPY